MLHELTGFHVHRGALASVHRRPLPDLADVLAGARRLAVIEDIVNHTNLGAIFRAAAALGIDGVVLSPAVGGPALPAFGPGVDGSGVHGALRAGAVAGPAASDGAAQQAGFTVAP